MPLRRGITSSGVFGLLPSAPTFFNTLTTVTEGNSQLTVDFIVPSSNGRINHYWIPVRLSYFC